MNNKGFTLIELLAVIVILAIVVVVTIPSVLNSMDTARQKQLENAVVSIESMVTKQDDLCMLKDTTLQGNQYKSTWFKSDCTLDTTVATSQKIIEAAGYSTTDIPSITGGIANVLKLGNIFKGVSNLGKFARWTANSFISSIGESSLESLMAYRDNKKIMENNLNSKTYALQQNIEDEF